MPITCTRADPTTQLPTTGGGVVNCITSAITPSGPAPAVTRAFAVTFALAGTPAAATPGASTDTGSAMVLSSHDFQRAVHGVEPAGAELRRAAIRAVLDARCLERDLGAGHRDLGAAGGFDLHRAGLFDPDRRAFRSEE